jgi:hypothetical protein
LGARGVIFARDFTSQDFFYSRFFAWKFFKKNLNFYLTARANSATTFAMDKNNIFKTGKALLFITSGLLLSDACFAAAPARPRAACVKWTPDEDDLLIKLVATHGVGKWVTIAKGIPGTTRKQCRQRYMEQLAPWINKDPWTPEEDNQLTRLVTAHGKGNWTAIAKGLPGRTGSQCQNHWRYLKDRAPQPQAPADQAQANPPLLSIQPAQQILHFPARIIDLLN